jgi:NRPS condensation-like uncharacterized protein
MQDTLILRPLDPGEAFFHMSDQVSCMNFVVFAERSGTLVPERIRSMLNTIQHENLLLQASVTWTEEQGLCFTAVPGAPIELRCHEVTMDNWQSCIEGQLSEPFAQGSAPLVRCLYLELASTRSVLALCFQHAVADGRSGTAILRRLLGLMATDVEPDRRKGPTLLPTMAQVHPEKYRWAEQADAARQLKTTLISDYRRHGPLPALPWLASEAVCRTPRFIRLSFTPDITKRLLTLARANGTSLHGALCAAQLMAQLRLQSATKPTAFFLSCPVDMRPHLEPVPPVSPTGLFVSLISATFLVSASTDLWELAREVIIQTRLQITRGEGHLFFNMYGLDGTPVLPDRLASFRQKSLASLPNTMVSNIGPIDTVADDPATDSISFALCPMPYQTLFTAASTYQGQLVLNVGFDAARLTQPNAELLAQGIRDVLLACVRED